MGAPPFNDDGVTVVRTIVAQGALTGPGTSPPFTAAASATVSLWGVFDGAAKVYVDRSKDGGSTWQASAAGRLEASGSDAAIETGNSFVLDSSAKTTATGLFRIRVDRLTGGAVNYVVWQ